ncbi:hypothetical protein BC829DRAFT_446747 [Chytridium lagenaria]|nr:hypothetical protein BC829DRAFT_446747 [Chytridium lagenaria]
MQSDGNPKHHHSALFLLFNLMVVGLDGTVILPIYASILAGHAFQKNIATNSPSSIFIGYKAMGYCLWNPKKKRIVCSLKSKVGKEILWRLRTEVDDESDQDGKKDATGKEVASSDSENAEEEEEKDEEEDVDKDSEVSDRESFVDS